jgi:ScaI restriction endonuclease
MTPQSGPYTDKPTSKWEAITHRLLDDHPLKLGLIHNIALVAWDKLWDTTVCSGPVAVRLDALDVPSTVIGYFFEVLFARELQRRDPENWRGNQSGDEKDLVYLKEPRFSVDIKTSGQLGDRAYGNRSYGQEVQNINLAKKEKSGYYITVNFYRTTLTLLRFGWIDASDWKPQSSETGQMAGLSKEVYEGKLIIIPGDYRLDGPVELLNQVGKKTAAKFHARQIHTIRDLLDFTGAFPERRLQVIRSAAQQAYRPEQQSHVEEGTH